MVLQRKFYYLRILPITLFLFFIFFSPSCTKKSHSQTKHLTEQERSDLSHLFNHLLIQNHGAYVLFGSKPISELFITPKLSAEEQQRTYSLLSEEAKKNITHDYDTEYDLRECWDTWQRLMGSFCSSRYLIVERPLEKDPRCSSLLLVGIENTYRLLVENYEFFREIYGRDFRPLEVIYQIEDSSSSFWNAVLKNQSCLGLLFGYGRTNAHLFPLWIGRGKKGEPAQAFLNQLSFSFTAERVLPSNKLRVKYLTPPLFRSLEGDEKIERYKKEQKTIKALYSKGDFLEISLAELTRR
ncbi:MAG: hypothetical protein K940chlam2_00226 [Chlamydiae bacterium]|nr:hypothetical protein [Chlamydiota bacterium]